MLKDPRGAAGGAAVALANGFRLPGSEGRVGTLLDVDVTDEGATTRPGAGLRRRRPGHARGHRSPRHRRSSPSSASRSSRRPRWPRCGRWWRRTRPSGRGWQRGHGDDSGPAILALAPPARTAGRPIWQPWWRPASGPMTLEGPGRWPGGWRPRGEAASGQRRARGPARRGDPSPARAGEGRGGGGQGAARQAELERAAERATATVRPGIGGSGRGTGRYGCGGRGEPGTAGRRVSWKRNCTPSLDGPAERANDEPAPTSRQPTSRRRTRRARQSSPLPTTLRPGRARPATLDGAASAAASLAASLSELAASMAGGEPAVAPPPATSPPAPPPAGAPETSADAAAAAPAGSGGMHLGTPEADSWLLTEAEAAVVVDGVQRRQAGLAPRRTRGSA